MTGTGTQNDPYIVSTWEELVTACNSSGNYVVCEAGMVVDFNDIFPSGYLSTSPHYELLFNTLIGNGIIFKNLLCADTATTYYVPIKFNGTSLYDIHIRNFVVENSNITRVIDFNVTNVYDSTFEFAVYGQTYHSAIQQASDYKNYRNCSFFILCSGMSGLFTGSYVAKLHNCLIHYENEDSVHIISSSYYDRYYMNNCLLEGKPKMIINTTTHKVNYPSFVSTNNTNYISYSIINADVNIPNEYSEYELQIQYADSISLVNKDKVTGIASFGSVGIDRPVHFLTDEQMKNPTYISNLGFPIRA